MSYPNNANFPTPYDTYSPDECEPEQISVCELCEQPIMTGDDYYHVNGQDICIHCIKYFKKVAGE